LAFFSASGSPLLQEGADSEIKVQSACALNTVYNQNKEVEEEEMGRECSTNGAKRNACSIFVGKLVGKRPL
jgi:hypothetical protein